MSAAQDEQKQILRELTSDKAFHFYTGIDRPAHISANSLGDLLTKMRSIPIESIEFHSSRGDFERWVHMLGDETLVTQLADLKKENLMGESLRNRSVQIVQSRYEKLSRPSSSSKGTSGSRGRPPGSSSKRDKRNVSP